jgi:hypothetical protein
VVQWQKGDMKVIFPEQYRTGNYMSPEEARK